MEKNPISELQEICMQRKLHTPIYEYIQLSLNPPIFQCMANVEKMKVKSEASSKQRAKTIAASMLLTNFKSSSPSYNRCPQTPAGAYKPKSLMDDIINMEPVDNGRHWTADSEEKNPVGTLNEYCSQKNFPYPQYIPDGMKVNEFVIICSHQGITTYGRGTTKKTAKQSAAYQMLIEIKEVKSRPNHVPTLMPTCNGIDEKVIAAYNKTIEVKSTSANKPTTPYPDFFNLPPPTAFSNPIPEPANVPVANLLGTCNSTSEPSPTTPPKYFLDCLDGEQPAPTAINGYTKPHLETSKENNEIKIMEKMLTAMSINYEVNTLKVNPYFLSAEINGKHITVYDKYYDDAKLKLLKAILEYVKLE